MYTLRLFFLLIIKVVYVTSVIRPLPPWIQVDDGTCLKVQKATIRNIFNQMVDIAEAAYTRIDGIAVLRPGSVAVVQTAFAYFGLNDRAGIPQRTERVKGYIDDIRNLATNPVPTTIMISCGDSYLTESITDNNGNPLPNGQYQLVDKRFSPWAWLQIGDIGCRNPVCGAYSAQPLNYIVLCPEAFASYPTLSRVMVDEDISRTHPNTLIDDIRPIATILLHEFLHILHGNTMAMAGEAYGYLNCITLSNTDTAATITMPDCIALFAYSLYLEGNNWSIGKPR